ncbi:hypothetical protein D9619_000414 [Psilocybe cf. subviscida]|uniref:CCHC-type domain-containing protein n=1 Tax=Psilocybe cf. subviscida TaxID=2480587 RepID=A0A8H5BH12_9AGAR|nr:hypothetical protein D9619_000414 [Psilocybe cf. subviscida]
MHDLTWAVAQVDGSDQQLLVQRWLDHFNFLFGQQDFESNFPAIRSFDIRIRREYFAVKSRIDVDSDVYRRKFESAQRDALRLELTEMRRQASLGDRSRPSSTSHRAEPYSRGSPSTLSGKRDHRTAPGGENAPICLICGRTGHRFSDCTNSVTEAANTHSTSVPSVVPQPTTPALVPASEAEHIRNLIVTPYNADAFESALSRYSLQHRFPHLVENLRHGFPLGYDMHPLTETFTPPNHPSASLHREQVLAFLEGERAADRMSGPFTQSATEQILGGHFRTSPIHVVVTQKADGTPKYRITINLLFPDKNGTSVNDMIDSADFPTQFGGPKDVEQIIVDAPPGTQAAALDVASAFRTIPICPDHKRYVVIMFEDMFWIDHCACFGCSSSGGNQGVTADATVAILHAMHIGPIPKWVDDFAPFRYPKCSVLSTPSSTPPSTNLFTPQYEYEQPSIPVNKRPRRTKHNSLLVQSHLRPHVRADQRLIAWSSPASLAKRSELASKFGPDEARAILELRLFSLEPKTRSNYAAGLLRFTQYCDSRRIPEEDRMPASEDLLSAFSTVMAASKVSRDTLDNWMSGIAFWHQMHSLPWYGGGRALKMTKVAVGKLAPESSKLPKRPPVTMDHMNALRRGLNLRNSFDSAVWAVATVAFWSCCRLGELLIPSAGSFDPSRHVVQDATVSFKVLPGGQRTALFHIPWSKTTHENGADVVITGNPELSDPFAALQHHIKVNVGGSGDSATPLFAFRSHGGGYSPLTRDWFMQRCDEIWNAAGLSSLQGHAFRIGGATELLLRGTHPDVVQVQGRWKSQAFLEYWRKIETILPLFITSSFRASRAARLTRTMASFNSS